MKLGSPFPDVIHRVQAQAHLARDYLASAHLMRYSNADTQPVLVLEDGSGARPFVINDVVHEQLADITGIPFPYYRRMRADAPDLLEDNINAWLQRSAHKHLVRTSHGDSPTVRALLSDRYRPLDHEALIAAILPILREEGVSIVSCELTERRLYVKALNQRVIGEVKVGQQVMAGVVISNSEVGLGAVQVHGLVYTLSCTNGATLEDASMRRHHIGKRFGGQDDAIQHLFSDETRRADDRAFFLRVRDVTRAALGEATFRESLGKLQRAAGETISAVNLEKVVELTSQRYHLSEEEGAGILAHFRHGGEWSRWGLCSAVTRHSQEVASYERASELERVGGQIIESPTSAWSQYLGQN